MSGITLFFSDELEMADCLLQHVIFAKLNLSRVRIALELTLLWTSLHSVVKFLLHVLLHFCWMLYDSSHDHCSFVPRVQLWFSLLHFLLTTRSCFLTFQFSKKYKEYLHYKEYAVVAICLLFSQLSIWFFRFRWLFITLGEL